MIEAEIANKLYSIKKKRVIFFSLVVSVFAIAWLIELLKLSSGYILFLIIGAGLTVIPYGWYVGLSTCPKCNKNYFGAFPQINRNSCAYCDLEMKNAKKT